MKLCRVVNRSEPVVQLVDRAHRWPETVSSFEHMLNPDKATPITFTNDGDRHAVLFIFYRVCFGLLHSFLPEAFDSAVGYELPEASLKLASEVQTGGGDGEDTRGSVHPAGGRGAGVGADHSVVGPEPRGRLEGAVEGGHGHN